MTIFHKKPNQKKSCFIGTLVLLISLTIHANTITSKLYATNGDFLGQVTFEDSKYGLLIKPQLSKLPVGLHGFHLHQHPDCEDNAMKAGGHFDPGATNTHQGPYASGHLGDLPVLAVDNNGDATTPLLAPRLKINDIQGHAVIIHSGGDNYTDTPPLGGGGARIACGKVPL